MLANVIIALFSNPSQNCLLMLFDIQKRYFCILINNFINDLLRKASLECSFFICELVGNLIFYSSYNVNDIKIIRSKKHERENNVFNFGSDVLFTSAGRFDYRSFYWSLV